MKDRRMKENLGQMSRKGGGEMTSFGKVSLVTGVRNRFPL